MEVFQISPIVIWIANIGYFGRGKQHLKESKKEWITILSTNGMVHLIWQQGNGPYGIEGFKKF